MFLRNNARRLPAIKPSESVRSGEFNFQMVEPNLAKYSIIVSNCSTNPLIDFPIIIFSLAHLRFIMWNIESYFHFTNIF